jgi:hypothetical protein
MLVRLLYLSKPVGPVTTTVTTLILEKSHANNKKANVTGVLCQGPGVWIQALEGERSQVNSLFARIMADRQHQNIEIMSMEEVTHRRFGQWSMALIHLDQNDPAVQKAHPPFDPYLASAYDAMSLLDVLLESSSPITILGT